MPSYLHADVAAACRALYTTQPEAASWVQAALASPRFEHPRVTGPAAPVPTGGDRASMLTTFGTVLGYLAQHGAWDHFQTVLTRGIAVSLAEDQDA